MNLDKTVIVDLVFRRPCMRRKADLGKIVTDTDKSMLTLSKLLVDSPEYARLAAVAANCRRKIVRLLYGWSDVTVPNIFKAGAYLVPTLLVEQVVETIKAAVVEYEAATRNFVEMYPLRISQAQERLGTQFCPEDYPPFDKLDLDRYFGVVYSIIKIEVPSSSVIGDLAEEEMARRKKLWDDMYEEVKAALRMSFSGMLQNLIEKLAPSPDGKRRVLRDTALDGVLDFIDKLKVRSIMEDQDLEQLVKQAQYLLEGLPVQALRTNMQLRDIVAYKLDEIKSELDQATTEYNKRQFSFEEA